MDAHGIRKVGSSNLAPRTLSYSLTHPLSHLGAVASSGGPGVGPPSLGLHGLNLRERGLNLRQQPLERLRAPLHPLHRLLHYLEKAVGGEGVVGLDGGEVATGYLGLDVEVVLGQKVGAALAIALRPRVDVAYGQVCERGGSGVRSGSVDAGNEFEQERGSQWSSQGGSSG